MKLIIGGGVGEHGRNCFYVEANPSFIVDCGIMRGSEQPYPHLTAEQIKKAKYLFITHSHEDHIGAFGWLIENGFSGTVIATEETVAELKTPYQKVLKLPKRRKKIELEHLSVEFGRSGHCIGSVWYKITSQRKILLFSGDYSENSCFNIDGIREQYADIAILDCSYGYNEFVAEKQLLKIKNYIAVNIKSGCVLLPVPKNGRAFDFLMALKDIDYPIYIDDKLKNYIAALTYNGYWLNKDIENTIQYFRFIGKPDISANQVLFVADPQLENSFAKSICEQVLNANGRILITGHADENSMSRELIESKRADYIPYCAHCCKEEADKIIAKNTFKNVVLYHTPEIDHTRIISL